jgi:hypothetical protein
MARNRGEGTAVGVGAGGVDDVDLGVLIGQ